ncbi:MAG TPA: DUF4043 domain-containing protein [Phycisphaerae bacterium]|nr:DUF4043 domain-containing protein [Phycisphaerae bacterium]
MPLNNLPAALQDVIQQNMLETAFKKPLEAKLGYRSIADQENFPAEIGETITKTRTGLLPAITTPLPPAANSDITSGLTPQNWATEQYVLGINQYSANQMLNVRTSRVAIADIFLRNAFTLGKQAAFSVDTLAYNVLFSSYIGGNTVVRVTLGAAGTAVSVNDIRGFRTTFNNEGQPVPVSATYPVNANVGSDTYAVVGAAADATNVSTTPGGISGVLTFSSAVSIADGTAGNAVVSAVAPLLVRPFITASGAMVATTGGISGANDQNNGKLTMEMLLYARATLADNGVPGVHGDTYRFFCSPMQAMGLFQDPAFQMLFRGQPNTAPFRRGVVQDILGIDLIETNLNIAQAYAGVGNVQRGILCGQGALIEGTFTNEAYKAADDADDDLITVVDGIAHIIREPLDALRQVVTQTWSYIGGFVVPTDMTTNPQTVPTASNARYKRAVMIESL